jgi:hypothetical protein
MEDMTAIEWCNTADLFREMEASLYFFGSQDISKSVQSWRTLQWYYMYGQAPQLESFNCQLLFTHS